MRVSRRLAGEISAADARAAVQAVHASFEIIETRGDAIAQMALALADNGQQRAVVLGPWTELGDRDLTTVKARVNVNGTEIATGAGSAVLGDPLNSVIWLAHKLAAFEREIRAGDLVMTGSFVRQFPLHAGDVVQATFEGIGDVEVRIAAK
jgi:2-keto-4-pentenoate hydratase